MPEPNATLTIDDRQITNETLLLELMKIYLVMKANRGDQEALLLCKAAQLNISGATPENPWFDYLWLE